jgi:restriction system protein
MKFFDRFLVRWIFITTILYIIFGIHFVSNETNFLGHLGAVLILWFITNVVPLLIICYRLKNNLLHSYEIKDWFRLFLPSVRKARALEREKLAKKEERAKKRRIKKNKIERENKAKSKQALIDSLGNEVLKILNENTSTIISAYRKTVKTSSFGKKNYDQFLDEFHEFITDQPSIKKIFKTLSEDHDDQVDINIDGVIDYVETLINDSISNDAYSDDIDPFEYEHMCASEFNKSGWEANATQGSSDQGVDVIAKRGQEVLVAQCKRFAKPVGNKAVQEVVAGLKFYKANRGVVIAPNGFTNSAEQLAEANNISLIHHSEIKNL